MAKSLENDSIQTRLQNDSLALGAILTYQLNALIYRPAEGHSEKILLEAACQHVIDGNECLSPILYNRGCYFLSDIAETNGSYHLPTIRHISPEVLEDLYRRDSMDDITNEFHTSRKRKQTSEQTSKINLTTNQPKRLKLTARIVAESSDNIWSGGDLDAETMDNTDTESVAEDIEDSEETGDEKKSLHIGEHLSCG